jgi:predicted DNA-binding transcriptional regulator AlpA
MAKLIDSSISELRESLAANERTIGPDAKSTRAIRRVLGQKLAAIRKTHGNLTPALTAAPICPSSYCGAMNAQSLLPTGRAARMLHVPAAWFRTEAEAGRLPHLKAGGVLLFHLPTVIDILTERAKGGNHAEGPALLDPEAVCRLLSINRSKLFSLIRTGKIPTPIRALGRTCPRWSASALQEWIASGCRMPEGGRGR